VYLTFKAQKKVPEAPKSGTRGKLLKRLMFDEPPPCKDELYQMKLGRATPYIINIIIIIFYSDLINLG